MFRHAGARDQHGALGCPLMGPRDAVPMWDEPVTTSQLRSAWQDAVRAAELAERLAAAAAEAARAADIRATSAIDIAELAEQAAAAAERAALRARAVATEAADLATRLGVDQVASEAVAEATRQASAQAAWALDEAERGTSEPQAGP